MQDEIVKKTILFAFCVALVIPAAGYATESEFNKKMIHQTYIQKNASGVLQEVPWQLEAYKDQAAWVSNFETERINIIFKQDARLNGFAGCNVVSAKYKITDDKLLSISSIRTTRKYCHSQNNIVMRMESSFLANMKKVATYALDYDALILFDQQEKQILVFKRKEQ